MYIGSLIPYSLQYMYESTVSSALSTIQPNHIHYHTLVFISRSKVTYSINFGDVSCCTYSLVHVIFGLSVLILNGPHPHSTAHMHL